MNFNVSQRAILGSQRDNRNLCLQKGTVAFCDNHLPDTNKHVSRPYYLFSCVILNTRSIKLSVQNQSGRLKYIFSWIYLFKRPLLGLTKQNNCRSFTHKVHKSFFFSWLAFLLLKTSRFFLCFFSLRRCDYGRTKYRDLYFTYEPPSQMSSVHIWQRQIEIVGFSFRHGGR